MQLGVKLEKQGIALTETLDVKEERAVVGAVLGEPLQSDDPLLAADDPTFPPDPSPPAMLPGGNLSSHLLPDVDRAQWEAAGNMSRGFLTGRWEVDEAFGGRKYWSVFEDPVYLDGSPLDDRLPQFDASADGMSISFWCVIAASVSSWIHVDHTPMLSVEGCGCPLFDSSSIPLPGSNRRRGPERTVRTCGCSMAQSWACTPVTEPSGRTLACGSNWTGSQWRCELGQGVCETGGT
eukprot:1527869-Rhodomonas_salina.1